jgi:hypothetical protein
MGYFCIRKEVPVRFVNYKCSVMEKAL